ERRLGRRGSRDVRRRPGTRRRRRADAHAGRPGDDAGGAALRRRRGRGARVPPPADRGRRARGHRSRADRDRPGDRVRQGPRAKPGADAARRCAARPSPAGAGRSLAEAVPRHDPGRSRGRSRRGHDRRGRGAGFGRGAPGACPRREGGRPRGPRGRRDRQGRRMIATEKRRVRVPSGELAGGEAGDPGAPPVVLLSGGFTSSHLWRHLVPLLAPWMRVLAPDLLGSGDSESPEGADLRLPAHAADARALLSALGIERFAVAGHGRGAGIAQLLAVQGGVEALVLVDAVAFDAWPSPRIEQLRSRLGEVDAAFIRSWLEGFFREGMGYPERLSEADLEEFRRPFAGPDGPERFVRIAAALERVGLVDLEPRLAELEIPAFVLWGEDDAFLPAELAERLGDALPWAAVALLPGCGHFPAEDAPETVAPLIVQWLRTQYLRLPQAHAHDEGAVTVELGRRPPE